MKDWIGTHSAHECCHEEEDRQAFSGREVGIPERCRRSVQAESASVNVRHFAFIGWPHLSWAAEPDPACIERMPLLR